MPYRQRIFILFGLLVLFISLGYAAYFRRNTTAYTEGNSNTNISNINVNQPNANQNQNTNRPANDNQNRSALNENINSVNQYSNNNLQAQVTLTIENFSYSAETMRINKGVKVIWVNKDTAAHTVTSEIGTFDSGLLEEDQQYERLFDQIGEFPYYCKPHPSMKATIIVTE